MMAIYKRHRNDFFTIRYNIVVCLFLVIVTLVVYWQVRNFSFISCDDGAYVSENQHVKLGITLEGIVWAFNSGYAGNWHPLTWLSHMLDCQLFGINPGRHHVINVLFHLVNTLLLFLIFYKMTREVWKSGIVAALFALHPLHVESVAWVAERKDVLSTFFGMLMLWCYIWYSDNHTAKRYLLVLLMFILGLMSKPMVVTFPFVLLLLDYWPLNRFQCEGSGTVNNVRLVVEKIPFFIVVVMSSIMTFIAQSRGKAVGSLIICPLRARIANALVSYVNYIGKMIWPRDLAILYLHPGMPPMWQVAGACLLLVALFFLVIITRKSHPFFIVGWLWYIGTLVPVIGLVQVGSQGMADRYTYIPLIGLFIMIAWGAPLLLQKCRYRNLLCAGILAVLLPILMALTWRQVRYWTNDLTLFEHAIEATPNNYVAHFSYGNALLDEGRTAEAIEHYSESLRINPHCLGVRVNLGMALTQQGKTTEAIGEYVKVLKIDPHNVQAHSNLGDALHKQGKIGEAIRSYSEAIRLDPDCVEAHVSLAIILTEQGKIEEAIDKYLDILRKYPNQALSHFNLGAILAAQGRVHEAIDHYLEALRIKPDYTDAHNNLGIALIAKGRVREAIDHYLEALRIKPDFANAHGNLGIAFASQRNFKKAMYHFQEALRIKPNYVEVHYNLGVVLARQARHRDAVNHFQEALRLKPDMAHDIKMTLTKIKGIKECAYYKELIKE